MQRGSRAVLASGHAAPVTGLVPALQSSHMPAGARADGAAGADIVASTAPDGMARLWQLGGGGGGGLHSTPLLECRYTLSDRP